MAWHVMYRCEDPRDPMAPVLVDRVGGAGAGAAWSPIFTIKGIVVALEALLRLPPDEDNL